MIKTLFVLFISVIGMPLYAICVALLYVLGMIFGWSYVDASVYVCEYVQPIATVLLAVIFLLMAVRKIFMAFRIKKKLAAAALSLLCVPYLVISLECMKEFFNRISTYSGMNNREIFDFVVAKLSEMSSIYPTGRFKLFTGESISYGYIMANMEVYIMPISIVLICGFIQWRITKRIKATPVSGV